MNRTLACLLLAGSVVLGLCARAGAEDPPRAPRIAWFTDLAAARAVAAQTGRPLLVALHVRPPVATPEATLRTRSWLAAYAEPEVVTLSRQLACVLRVVPLPEGSDEAAAPGVTHLVLDGQSRILARLDAERPAAGDLVRLLRQGLAVHGPIAADAPLIDESRVPALARRADGVGPMQPVAVPHGVPGVRLRLRWALPTPALGGAAGARVQAGVALRWDGAGPFALTRLSFGAGEELDVPIDVRFDEIEGLADLATKGLHRADLYLVPEPGSYPFSQGPLHVGRVWIDLGEGGGGGASEDPGEAPAPPAAPPPPPEDPLLEGDAPPPEPPPEQPDSVVDPFVRDGDTVKKEDAVVAVEDPGGGVKPPARVPLEQALRDFEKVREKEVGREDIPPRDRAFLLRYFERLRAAVQKAPK